MTDRTNGKTGTLHADQIRYSLNPLHLKAFPYRQRTPIPPFFHYTHTNTKHTHRYPTTNDCAHNRQAECCTMAGALWRRYSDACGGEAIGSCFLACSARPATKNAAEKATPPTAISDCRL